MNRTEYEQELKVKYEVVGAVLLSNGGYAYFRRPTQEEYDTFQSLALEKGDSARIAFTRYVRGCFCGAFPEQTLDEIVKVEGPACISGAFGSLVNELAGSQDRPTRML